MPCFSKSRVVWFRKRATSLSIRSGAAVYTRSSKNLLICLCCANPQVMPLMPNTNPRTARLFHVIIVCLHSYSRTVASPCAAGTGRPAGGVRLPLEVRAVQIGLRQVLRILDRRRDDQMRVTIRLGDAIEVLRQRGLRTVWDAVLPQVPGLEIGSDDLQRTGERRLAAKAGEHLPLGRRRSLPRGGGGLCGRKREDARLRARVSVDLHRPIVLPGDVQAAGHAHDVRRAVAAALLTGGFIPGRIPRVGDRARGGIQRNARVVPLRRDYHAEPPVPRDDSGPV